MKLDEQMKKCGLCGRPHNRTTPLVGLGDRMFCGECLPKIIKEQNKIILEEAIRRVKNES